MDGHRCSLAVLGVSLALVSGCPEPEEEGGLDGTGETGELSAGTGVEGQEDVRPPLDAGGEGEETGGDEETGDGDGDPGGDGDGGPVDPPERCWDRQLVPDELPAVLFDNTIGRNDDVLSACGADPSPDLQVRFVAPFAGAFVLDSSGSAFDTVLSVAAGACGEEIACNDDFIGLSSRLIVELDAGEEITISVDGTNPFEEGPVKLSVDEFVAPACEFEQLTPPYPKQVAGDTSFGVDELESPCGGGGAPEQLLRFVPQGPGTYRFSTEGSSFDTVLYLLDDCDSLPTICNDDVDLQLHSELLVEVAAGQTFIVVVDGADPDELGEFVLSVDKL